MNEEMLYEKAYEHKDRDFLQIATAFDNTIRIYVCKSTQIVKDAQKVHELYPTATAALGRLMTATLIMGAMLKGGQSIAVKLDGGGPLGKIICESDASGRVMGYLGNGGVYLKYSNGKLNVGDAVGRYGTLTVVKDLHLKEPFTSTVPIISGEIGEDIAYYFAESEQVPTSVSVGVLVGLNEECLAAGGFIIQVMPGCKEESIAKLEESLKNVAPISQLIAEGKTGRDIIKTILGDEEFNILKTMPVKFACSCSKERFTKGIKSLGYDAVKKILNEDQGLTATCQYCHTQYTYTADELLEIVNNIKKGNK